MARLAPKKTTLLRLFALSGNRCAFDGCNELVFKEHGKLIGEVCHIEAAAEGGPRFNSHQLDEDRRHFDNLLVLCRNHHEETHDAEQFPVERMRQMKTDHQRRFLSAPFELDKAKGAQLCEQAGRQLRLRLKDIAPPRLPHAARTLIGRDEELKRLDAAWEDPQRHVMAIIAWGGVGKSALAAEWTGRFAERGWEGVDAYFDWSFYSQGTRDQGAASADVFIAAALEHFGDEDPQAGSPTDRGDRLARLVAERRSLLVLDGLEPLQHGTGPLAGRLKDPAVDALLKGLAQRPFAGLCVLTSREPVTDLDRWHGKTVDEWNLEHLSDEAGAELLHRAGANRAGEVPIAPDDKELLAASREVDGHALTLQLLGGYLKRAKRGDVRRRDTVELHEAEAEFKTNIADAEEPYGHAFKVMMAYQRWLGESPDGRRQLGVLRMMGLFDRAAPGHCIDALRAEPSIAGLTDAVVGLAADPWNATLDALEELGLLERTSLERKPVRGFSEEKARTAGIAGSSALGEPEEFPQRGVGVEEVLEAHPLIREYFGRRVQQTDPDAWRQGHRRLFEQLCRSVPYWPEGIDALQPLYQAVAHGCQAGLHQQACDKVYCDRILRGTGPGGLYSSRKLGAIGADLGAVACFFEEPWSRPSENLSPVDRAWLLNEAAYRLRALGRLSEAVEPMQATLKINASDEQWKNAAVVASNLSELEVTLGEISAAVTDAGQSVTFADRSGDVSQRMINCTTHADALHQAGRREDALRLFRQAEAMQAERQPEYPRLYSVQGFQYCDLLLADAERAAWCRVVACNHAPHVPQPTEPARGCKQPPYDLPACTAACDEVTERATQTLAWVTPENWLLDIAMDHLTLGRAALYGALLSGADGLGAPPADGPPSGPATLAREHLAAAVEGLRESGTTHHLPCGLLSRAWLRFVAGDQPGCRADLEEAWEIAERGSMRLYQADVQLTRARLFRDPAALAEARRLIQKTGYHRRDDELTDAQQLLGIDG